MTRAAASRLVAAVLPALGVWPMAASAQALVGASLLQTPTAQAESTPVVVEGIVSDVRGPATDAVVYLLPLSPQPGDVRGPGAARTPATVVMDQVSLRFQPSVVAVPAGSTVQFLNSDPIMHNVFSPRSRGADFDLGTYPARESRPYTFSRPGAFLLLCHVHPEMAGWVIVLEGHEFATTDESGAFSIPDVQPGQYELRVWHRRRDLQIDTIAISGDGSPRLEISVPRSGRR